MIKTSVKKPYTVFVAVVAVIVIGIVSLMNMRTNLLPEMELPYMIVITTYPGAGPEKVEENVTKPMENALSGITGIESVSSTSAENYSMVTLQFVENTNMDSAMVKVSAAINQIESSLPDTVGTPNILELSMDSLATVYTSVSYEGMDIYEFTDYVKNTLTPRFERLDGVARVSPLGLVTKSVELRLNSDKIDEINEKILISADEKLAEAKEKLDDAKAELSDAREEVEKQTKELETSRSDASSELSDATLGLNQALATKAAYEANLAGLKASKSALEAEKSAYSDADIKGSFKQINSLFKNMKKAVASIEEQYGEYSPYSSDRMPADIYDAIDSPEKLAYFKEVVAGLSATEGSGIDASIAATADSIDVAGLKQIVNVLDVRMPQIETELANLSTEIAAAEAAVNAVMEQIGDITESYKKAEEGKIEAAAGFGSGDAKLSAALSAIEDGEKELETAFESYEESVKTVRDNANINALLSLDTLSGLIYAQNFSMPAGYIDDESDQQWMLKIGENYESADELYSMVLCNIDGVGDIKLSDVADMTIIDDSMDSYTRVNGEPGIIMSIYKTSVAGTSDVSKAYKNAAAAMMEEDPNLNITTMVDQGDYIDIIISSIVSSMGWGALLAVLILAIFLMDIKPTLVVAFSIPFSVITAIVIMYFANISINVMSLSGLSLGIGMLVDNSIVVIENIYRLRYNGLSAPKASVKGAKQVGGAIIGSTLTTVCVFMPIVFTDGLVRKMMLPFALTISFALVASLIVALTVVPALGSVILRNVKEEKTTLFDHLKNVYEKALNFCLRFKAVPLVISVALLAISIYMITQMGIVMIPDVKSQQIAVSAELPDDTEKEEAFAEMDELMDNVMAIDGVEYVSVMDSSGRTALLGSGTASSDFKNFTVYVLPDDDHKKAVHIEKMIKDIEEATANLPGDIGVSSSMMGSMTALLGNGLEIDIYGTDTGKLLTISEDFMDILSEYEGLEEITNGQEDAKNDLHLIVDRDKAASLGLTTAGIYQEISALLTTQKKAVTMTVDDADMEVVVVDETDPLTRENLLDMEFEVDVKNDDGETEKEIHKLSEFAHVTTETGYESIARSNGDHTMSVSAVTKDGYNTALISREVKERLDAYEMPEGFYYEFGGETQNVTDMVEHMSRLALLGFLLIYLIMVAQFQSFLSPFIVIFTIPLAFTGGLFGLAAFGEKISMISLLGFLMLMGTVVNNGIVFVDYTNQMRLSGLSRHEALVVTGRDRLRPILMTALTTILAMTAMIMGDSVGAALTKGMGVVVAAGLLYATFMTLFIVPVLYDIFYKKEVYNVDVDTN